MADGQERVAATTPDVMLWVAGKRFICACGANVFSKIKNEYRCNGCRREYA